MWYAWLADLVVVLHLSFVLLVVLGGLLVLKWRRVAWWHLPAVVWGTLVEFTGWICPLTPLENRLRALTGQQGYDSDFIARYLLPLLYPERLTHDVQVFLGTLVVGLNLVIYGSLWRRSKRRDVDPAP
jgi:hypothetical protein